MIRKTIKSDIDAICEMSNQKGLSNSLHDGFAYKEWYEELLLEPTVLFFSYIRNDKCMGFILGEPLLTGGVMLWSLGVDPQIIGSGAGIRLLKYFENECKQRGHTWIYADGFVDTIDSEKALRLGYETSHVLYKGYFKELS
jgi:N-acetylglutamate synthase-like GNAT family acetyltransferase